MEDIENLVDTLVDKFRALGLQSDHDLAREFLEDDDENKDLIETPYLRRAFRSFLDKKKLEEKANKFEEKANKFEEKANKAEALIAKEEMAAFVNRKFPPLVRGSGTANSHPRDAQHADATLKTRPKGTFGLLTNQLLPMENEVGFTLKTKLRPGNRYLPYTTEASLVSIIELILGEARVWLNQEQLFIQQEYGLAGGRPDIVVILGLHGVPVGAIEVKLPNPDPLKDQDEPMDQGRLHGQLLDYLLILRQVYGVEHPLGIATTYQSWRFCWLPESEDFVREVREVRGATKEELTAKVSELSLVGDGLKLQLKTDQEKLAAVPPLGKAPPGSASPPGLLELLKAQRQENKDTSKLKRVLHGTEVLSYDDPELPRHIVSFLHKLTYVPVLSREVKVGWHYPRLSKESFDWEELHLLPITGTFPASSTKSFWLLRQLGSGAEGKAWEATTDSGATCAVKIFDKGRPEHAEERQAEELKNWNDIWGMKKAFKRELLGRPALVMPLVLTAPFLGRDLPRDLPEELIKATLEALEHLVQKGYTNTDLAWRHVGFYREGDQFKALMLDIRLAAKTETSLEEMKRHLRLNGP